MSELKLRYIAAIWASAGSMLMIGTSASGGRSPRTWSTFEPISARAEVASWLRRRMTLISERPCMDEDSM